MSKKCNNLLRITHNVDYSYFYICPCTKCAGDIQIITDVDSKEKARALGWVFTCHEKFSEDGALVAICPSCVQRILTENNDKKTPDYSAIVDRILWDLRDRSGIQQGFDGIDDEVMEEIKTTMASIIKKGVSS